MKVRYKEKSIMKWIYADEEQPDTDRRVIVIVTLPTYQSFNIGDHKPVQYVVEGYYKDNWYVHGGYDMRKFVTHWSDFPPKKQNDKNNN